MQRILKSFKETWDVNVHILMRKKNVQQLYFVSFCLYAFSPKNYNQSHAAIGLYYALVQPFNNKIL